jgi:predicted HicB family RNase H-like nuclease
MASEPAQPESESAEMSGKWTGVNPITPFERKLREVERVAQSLIEQQPDWTIIFREVLGVDGAAKRLFRTEKEMQQFTQSDTHQRIQEMLVKLSRETPSRAESPTRVITVRVPASLHDTLREEARQRGMSLNKLCISRLLEEEGEI